MEILKTNNSK